MCVHNGSVQRSSMERECRHRNEKPSSFITGLIECNLPAIGVSLTQLICPSRYGSVRDLGFRSALSALDRHVEVSCVRSLAGRLRCLYVISGYELLGSGLETPELQCWKQPKRTQTQPSPPFWWGGEREIKTRPSILPKQEEAQNDPRAAYCTCPANPHAYSK